MSRVREGLGDKATEWLERGFEERVVKMVRIGVDPRSTAFETICIFRASFAG